MWSAPPGNILVKSEEPVVTAKEVKLRRDRFF
jgi:hypothetical protein